jgi:hypothetical protein
MSRGSRYLNLAGVVVGSGFGGGTTTWQLRRAATSTESGSLGGANERGSKVDDDVFDLPSARLEDRHESPIDGSVAEPPVDVDGTDTPRVRRHLGGCTGGCPGRRARVSRFSGESAVGSGRLPARARGTSVPPRRPRGSRSDPTVSSVAQSQAVPPTILPSLERSERLLVVGDLLEPVGAPSFR